MTLVHKNDFIGVKAIIIRLLILIGTLSIGYSFQQHCTPSSLKKISVSYFGKRKSTASLSSKQLYNGLSVKLYSSSTQLGSDEYQLLVGIREIIEEKEDKEDWKSSVEFLRQSAFVNDDNDDLAEWYLAKAMGWVSWSRVTSERARKYMAKPTIPKVEELRDALEWIQSTAALPDIGKAIQTSPEIYLKNPAQAFKKVKQCAPREYRDDEKLLELIRLNPLAIQNTYNCDGDGCASECGNCWVSFANRS